jgi:hypothetical protein
MSFGGEARLGSRPALGRARAASAGPNPAQNGGSSWTPVFYLGALKSRRGEARLGATRPAPLPALGRQPTEAAYRWSRVGQGAISQRRRSFALPRAGTKQGVSRATLRLKPFRGWRLGHTSKTRHQKRPAETGGRNGASIAKFRTRRQAHICKTSRYRAVFERSSYVTRWRRTGWLGWEDSNLRISIHRWQFEKSKKVPSFLDESGHQRLSVN